MHHPLCIYHKDCLDGFAAAWVVWKAFHGHIDVFAAEHQAPPLDISERRDVVIVDFSYPRPVMLSMAGTARGILVIDHHSTAQDALSNLPKNVTVKFDMDHSGCMLAFRHFFPDDEPPVLLRHIEDRDLWRFALPGTREVAAALQSYQQDFMLWDDLMASSIDTLYVEGVAILRRYEVDLQEAIAQTRRIMHIAGYSVPAANVPKFMASDAGALLAKGAPFSVTYHDAECYRVFSLRSAPDGMNVAEIAKRYGGGGHPHAAGFKVPRNSLLSHI